MLLLLILAIIAAILYYYGKLFTYWKTQGVPQGSITFNVSEMFKIIFQRRNVAHTTELYYNMFPESRYCGVYAFFIPVLVIKDPELLKELTVKNFDHFVDRSSNDAISENSDPLWTRNIFALKGQKWREMRPILSPSFTSSKMRIIFRLISECAQNFSNYYLKQDEQIVELELKDSFSRFTNDVIATSAFGIKIDSLENKDNQFYLMGKEFSNFGRGILNGLKLLFLMIAPKICGFLKIGLFNKKLTAYFTQLIENTINTRKEQGIVRPDMIHLLLEAQKGLANKEGDQEDSSFDAETETVLGKQVQKQMTNVDIAAQALIFFLAGFETVSALLCFMAYELAVNPDVQKKLRDEIKETLENCQGNLTYEALLKMKYMDMVVSESLRKWPTAVVVDRECTKPYTIQPKLPDEKAVHIKQKNLIWMPIFAIHRDPNVYPDPDRFDPERFNEENKGNITPYNYIPFGLGPRNCIGSRFALLEIKTVFFYLLENFELVPTKKSQIPLKLPPGFSLTPEGGFQFGLKKLEK